MPSLLDVAESLPDGTHYLSEVLELDTLDGHKVTEERYDFIQQALPWYEVEHSGFCEYELHHMVRARAALADLDPAGARERRQAARMLAERDGAFALFDFDELWDLAWAGFLLEHIQECQLLQSHAPVDFQDCLWQNERSEWQAGADAYLPSIERALHRFEGQLFEQRPGRRGYALPSVKQATLRQDRRDRAFYGLLGRNLALPTWTTLTVTVRPAADRARLQLAEPLTAQARHRQLWVTKLVLHDKPWTVLTAPALQGAADPIIGQLPKPFCTWNPRHLHRWKPRTYQEVGGTTSPLVLTWAVDPTYALTALERALAGWVPTPDYFALGWELLEPEQMRSLPSAACPTPWHPHNRRDALTHCLYPGCGNPLTDHDSVRRGYGPVCAEKLTGEGRAVGLQGPTPSTWGAIRSLPTWATEIRRRLATLTVTNTGDPIHEE